MGGPENSNCSLGLAPGDVRKSHLHFWRRSRPVDQSGRSGVNFNPGDAGGQRNRLTVAWSERAGRRGRANVAGFGRHITGQMSDDRTRGQAYISIRSNSQPSPAQPRPSPPVDRPRQLSFPATDRPPLPSSCHAARPSVRPSDCSRIDRTHCAAFEARTQRLILTLRCLMTSRTPCYALTSTGQASLSLQFRRAPRISYTYVNVNVNIEFI